MEFIRLCPLCNIEIKHKGERYCKEMQKNNVPCKECKKKQNAREPQLTRNCPQCNKIIHYTNEGNCKTAIKHGRLCFDCGLKNRPDYNGINNPFYGKHHTEEVKQKSSHFNKFERILSDDWLSRARENMARITNKRPLYDIWLEKFGKEIADQKLKACKEKHSENNSGSNNPMYGKPSPHGSGNGWSGWYKGWYFRSLRELSYMINVIEKEQLQWYTPDKNFKILYEDYEGKIRTYFPDFIINENKIIEIKPKKLHNTPKVLAKKKAAEEFYQKINMTYEIIDPVILKEEDIKNLYITGQIKFLDRYEDKFKKRYLK